MTDTDYKTLVAEARKVVDVHGIRQSTLLIDRLSDAVEALQAERDEALRALGESRQRFADSEMKRAELEAALDAVRKLATGPTPTVDEWWPLLRSIAAAATAVPSVVLQDRDREVAARAWDEGYDQGYDFDADHLRKNPYRADQDGEQS